MTKSPDILISQLFESRSGTCLFCGSTIHWKVQNAHNGFSIQVERDISIGCYKVQFVHHYILMYAFCLSIYLLKSWMKKLIISAKFTNYEILDGINNTLKLHTFKTNFIEILVEITEFYCTETNAMFFVEDKSRHGWEILGLVIILAIQILESS